MTHLQGTGDGRHQLCPLRVPSPDFSSKLILLLNFYSILSMEELGCGDINMNKTRYVPSGGLSLVVLCGEPTGFLFLRLPLP